MNNKEIKKEILVETCQSDYSKEVCQMMVDDLATVSKVAEAIIWITFAIVIMASFYYLVFKLD